jgi:hypothetical protein
VRDQLNNTLEKLLHPAIYAGDFNSHNQAWEYEHNDIDGNRLMEWMTLYKMNLIYHPKDIGTFRSARWQKDYTPDLSMMTQVYVLTKTKTSQLPVTSL